MDAPLAAARVLRVCAALCVVVCCGLQLAGAAVPPTAPPVYSHAGTVTPVVADPGSGCSCKTLPVANHVVCFDRVSCRRFPRNFTVPGSALSLKTSVIPELAVGDLDLMHHLEELSLENGLRLSHIQPGAFQGMTHLVRLTVSFNRKLSHLEPGAFRGLVSLRNLTLEKNAFKTLADASPALGPIDLPKLDVLVVKENPIHTVDAGDLQPMSGSPLTALHLVSCQVVVVHQDALLPLSRLRKLRLDGNHLNASVLAVAVDRLVAAGVPLATLSLQSTEIRDEPPADLLRAVARSSVTELVLAHNELRHLSVKSLGALPRLRVLDLTAVDLSTVEPGSLSPALLPSLQMLNLSYNRLREVQPGFLTPTLVSLDLSGSSVSGRPGQDYFELGANLFSNMSALRELRVSYARINRLTAESLAGLSELRALFLRNSTLFRLDEGALEPLRELRLLDLGRNPFPTVRNMTPGVFRGLGGLRELRLDGCSFTYIAPDLFGPLQNLSRLHLQDNLLVSLEPLFQPLRALAWLDVSNNDLGAWRSPVLSSNRGLREVRVAGNRLTHLTPAMLDDLAPVDVVDLSRNPFSCSCDYFLAVSEWLARPGAPEARAGLPRLYRYWCLSPDEWRDHRVSEYMAFMTGRSDCWAGELRLAVAVAVPAALLTLGGLALGGLLYRYRHHLRYWGFVARTAMGSAPGARQRGELTAYANFQYDAFVSYSSEDHAFVQRLVAMLEQHEPYFRLCVYERDFCIGQAITEAVLGSVAQSRRVLLVVSQAFARSQWCAWEAHMAHQQRLFGGLPVASGSLGDSLLVVRLGPLDERKLTPTLRYLLRTRIYLQFDPAPDKQTAFWTKLRQALAPPIGRPISGPHTVGPQEELPAA